MINKGVLLVLGVIFVICFAIFVGTSCIFHYAFGLSFGYAVLATVGFNLTLLVIFLIFSLIDCEKFSKSVDKD